MEDEELPGSAQLLRRVSKIQWFNVLLYCVFIRVVLALDLDAVQLPLLL